MSDEDRNKRVKAQSEKRKKLVNPLFFVSAHRLSVKNLSKKVTDTELRALCVKATLAGMKKGLVTTVDQDAHLTALGTPSVSIYPHHTPQFLNSFVYPYLSFIAISLT